MDYLLRHRRVAAYLTRDLQGEPPALRSGCVPEAIRGAFSEWAGRNDEPRMAARSRQPEGADGDPRTIRGE